MWCEAEKLQNIVASLWSESSRQVMEWRRRAEGKPARMVKRKV